MKNTRSIADAQRFRREREVVYARWDAEVICAYVRGDVTRVSFNPGALGAAIFQPGLETRRAER